MAYSIARRSFIPFVRLFAKTIEGMENIPTDGPVILAANHLGLLDPVFLGAIYVQRTTKKLRFLVDTRHMYWKLLGQFLQPWTNTIPIRPTTSDSRRAAVEQGAQALQRGDSIGIFPEGRVNKATYLLPGRTGAVRISLLAGVRMIPVGIENTNVRMLTIIGRRMLNQTEGIAIRFGRPYSVAGNADDEQVVRRLTDELMNRIANLSGKPYVR